MWDVVYIALIQPRKHMLDHADYMVLTRQHQQYHTDHTDHGSHWPGIPRSLSGNDLYMVCRLSVDDLSDRGVK